MQQGHLHEGSWSVRFSWTRQDLDTPYVGSSRIPNPEDRRTLQDSVLLGVDYGLRERVNLGLQVPLRNSRSSGEVEADLDGLGDVGLSARFGLNDPDRARWKLSALGLVTLPTGDVETSLLDENIALGVGAVSVGGGAELIRTWPRAGELLLQVLGAKPTGASDEGVRFGGYLSAQAGYGRPFVAGGRARWAASAAVTWTEPDREDGRDVENRGGRLAHVTGGLSFPLGGRWDLSVGAQRLIDAEVHGDQLIARWSGFLGLRWLWERELEPPVLVP